jgi:hypothetical protein
LGSSNEEEEEIKIPTLRNSSITLRTWASVARRRRRRRWTIYYVENRMIPIPNCHWQNGFVVMLKRRTSCDT